MDRLKPQGDYISKEQFCKQAHVSKRKAVELMQNGTVPAIDTHRKTRRYWIAQEDVDRYILNKTKRQLAAESSHLNKVRCEGLFLSTIAGMQQTCENPYPLLG